MQTQNRNSLHLSTAVQFCNHFLIDYRPTFTALTCLFCKCSPTKGSSLDKSRNRYPEGDCQYKVRLSCEITFR